MKMSYLKNKDKKEGTDMKKGILVTSFGTTYEQTRKLCIESIENRIKEEFEDSLVLRAFTSRMIMAKLKKRDNYFVDNPREALEEMKANGIKDIYIQPLLIIGGHEYDKIIREADEFLLDNKEFKISVGKPLLDSELDCKKVVEGLSFLSDKSNEAVVFMGHGSDHNADISYEKLENIIRTKGYNNVFIGTVEGRKTIDDIVVELKNKKIEKVNLKPFMLVAGDHATNDMASDDDDSWKSILERNNIKVEVEIKGLGEVRAIQDIFINHLKDTLINTIY